jgi:hypothetical protein
VASSVQDECFSAIALTQMTRAFSFIGSRGFLTLLFDMAWAHRDAMKLECAKMYYDAVQADVLRSHWMYKASKDDLQMVNLMRSMGR